MADAGNGRRRLSIKEVAAATGRTEKTIRKRCDEGHYEARREAPTAHARWLILCDESGVPAHCSSPAELAVETSPPGVEVVDHEMVKSVAYSVSLALTSAPGQPDVGTESLKAGEPVALAAARVRARGEERKGLFVAIGLVLLGVILGVAYLVGKGILKVRALWWAKEALVNEEHAIVVQPVSAAPNPGSLPEA